jgi:hypothetical protein
MATGQATEAAKAGSLGKEGHVAYRLLFPAPSQGDASARGLGTPG